jgi:membrane-associated phospholipid phosphatase
VVGAWVTVDVLLDGPLRHLDHRVSDLALDTGIRAADWPQRLFVVKLGVYALTQLGARDPMVLLSCLAVAGVAWRRRTARPVVLLGLALALVGGTVYAAKHAVGRSMPATDVLHGTAGQTFPSGHVPTAVVLWGLLAWLAAAYRLPRRLTWALGVLRWLAPALVFAAMVLLDYHWLTDVVAGLALGVVLLRVLQEADRWALRDWPGGEHRRIDVRPDTAAGDRAADRPEDPAVDRAGVRAGEPAG